MRVHHLFDHGAFSGKFRKLVEGRFKRYGNFEYDTEGEIVRYKVSSLNIFCLFPVSLIFVFLGIGRTITTLRR